MSIYGDRSVNQARIQQSPSVVGPINTTDPSHQDHLSTSKICKWLRTFSQFHRTSSHDIARFTVSWNSKDLSALRLVCREASDKVFDIFLDVHFSTFTVLITQEESLRTLLAIAQYERFARAIRRLVFCTDIVAERPPEQCRLKMDPEIAALPRPSDKDIKRNQKQAVARQRRPRHCAVDLELLTEIFTALARVGGAFEVDVTVMERNAGYAPLRPWGSKTLQTPIILFKAMRKTKFPIEKLSMLHHRWFEVLWAITEDSKNFPEFGYVFDRITHFEMDCVWQDCEPKFPRMSQDLFVFDHTFHLLHELESLTVHADNDDNVPWSVHLHSAVVHNHLLRCWPRLLELDLNGMVLDCEVLCSVLKKCNRVGGFRSLRLAFVNLYCADHVGAFTEGGGEAHRRFREGQVKEHPEERTGIENISLAMCDARNGPMPSFEGIECGPRGYSTMKVGNFMVGYLL